MERRQLGLALPADTPQWVVDLRSTYSEPEPPKSISALMSGPERGINAADFIRESLIPRLKIDRVRICDIGIGLKSWFISQPWEPYVIASQLESHGIDYDMTLVDIDKRALEHVRESESVYISDTMLNNLFVGFRKVGWERYLFALKIESQYITEQEEGLKLFPGEEKEEFLEDLYSGGYHKAPIPAGFQAKLKNNEVQLVNANIATID